MKRLLPFLLLAVSVAHAQDVHVRVSKAEHSTPESTTVFPTIQMAMDHAPQPGPGGRLYVEIAPGTYNERVMITANRPRTTFIGDSGNPSNVVIAAAQNVKSADGTFFTESVDVESPEFEADGVTFSNTAGKTGQAVAIAVRSDKAIFKHCRFLGYQDTVFADYGRQYYLDSYITGGVDFMFGNAAAVFDGSEIHEQTPGFLTAQSRTAPDQATGYVIYRSRVTHEELSGHTFFLGRPWRAYARVVVMQTELPSALNPQGWSAWRRSDPTPTAFYAEYANTGPGADTGQRVAWSHQLTAHEAKQFLPEHFLRGKDKWNPVAAAAKLP